MVERIESDLISSNVFVVSNDNVCIIVDAGAKLELVEPVVGEKKVEAILLTHGHYDHCFRVLDYAKKFGCKIYCSQYAKEYLENPVYNYSEGKFEIHDFSNFIFLENEGTINTGAFDVNYKTLGGHSKGDMVFFVKGDLFVGDILIGRDMGRIDLFGGDAQQMKESLTYLIMADYQIMHSGHDKDNSKGSQDKVASLWLRFLNRSK